MHLNVNTRKLLTAARTHKRNRVSGQFSPLNARKIVDERIDNPFANIRTAPAVTRGCIRKDRR